VGRGSGAVPRPRQGRAGAADGRALLAEPLRGGGRGLPRRAYPLARAAAHDRQRFAHMHVGQGVQAGGSDQSIGQGAGRARREGAGRALLHARLRGGAGRRGVAAMRCAILVAAALAFAAPAAAETLKKVPAALNPAKAYILVEYKLQRNPFANFPGSRKTMPLQAGLAFARWDSAAGDIRGMGKAKPLPAGEQAMEGFRNKPLAKGEGT